MVQMNMEAGDEDCYCLMCGKNLDKGDLCERCEKKLDGWEEDDDKRHINRRRFY